MSLIESLLRAVVHADGSAMVMHLGERPYVVTGRGHVKVSSRALTADAVSGLLGQLLTPEANRALDEFGAVEHPLPPSPDTPGERFDVIAARGGHDVWVEIRRRQDETPQEDETSRQDEMPSTVAEEPAPASAETTDIPEVTMVPVPPSRLQPPEPIEDVAPPSGPASGFDEGRGVEAVGPRPTVAGDGAEVVGPLLARLLGIAAARGASALYVVSGVIPAVRVDGVLCPLEDEDALGTDEVEDVLGTLGSAGSAGQGAEGESSVAVGLPDVGLVRCTPFCDRRGPGVVCRLTPRRRPRTFRQLGLSREAQALFQESDGLILVAGPRSSGKRSLAASIVDRVNHTRADHVITFEREIGWPCEEGMALVSQRTLEGDAATVEHRVRAAIEEQPDLLVIEELHRAELARAAIDAASRGLLVVGLVTAPSISSAIGRLLARTAPDQRGTMQLALADVLRGGLAQVLVRKTGGGRLAAREVLIGTAEVASLIATGAFGQLPAALERGRAIGMVPLPDALVAFVQSGAVDAREAYWQAPDRSAFLDRLAREGIDTSFADRLD